MWLRIVDIDFDASRVHLEVAPEESEEFFTRLDTFASRCAAENLRDVRLHYRRGTSRRNVTRLEDFCAMKRLEPPNERRPRVDDSPVRVGFSSEPVRRRKANGGDGPRTRYRIAVDRIDRAVERINKTIALIGESEDLDPRTALQLRLCVYELTTNAVEHGAFSTIPPMICLDLVFSEDRVSVTYRDNAGAFLTDSPASIDLVEEQINNSSKRGLGLYILGRLCSDFKYKREDDWNVSSFSLEVNRETVSVIKR